MVGKSQAAAHKAVVETAISRYILAVPVLMPATALFLIERARLMPRSFPAQTLLQMFFFFCEMYLAVPLGIAFYPQQGTIEAGAVEDQLKSDYKVKNGGKLPPCFQYNKGL